MSCHAFNHERSAPISYVPVYIITFYTHTRTHTHTHTHTNNCNYVCVCVCIYLHVLHVCGEQAIVQQFRSRIRPAYVLNDSCHKCSECTNWNSRFTRCFMASLDLRTRFLPQFKYRTRFMIIVVRYYCGMLPAQLSMRA